MAKVVGNLNFLWKIKRTNILVSYFYLLQNTYIKNTLIFNRKFTRQINYQNFYKSRWAFCSLKSLLSESIEKINVNVNVFKKRNFALPFSIGFILL